MDRNYETLQSPTYYFLAGCLLRAIPRLDPIDELIFLRCLNALLAFAVGLLALRASRLLGFGDAAWLPVAVLAFVPGYSLAMVRVSNDALCAVVVSVAVVGVLRSTAEARTISWQALAAGGMAPWMKLYGWAVVPGLLWNEVRRRESLRRMLGVLIILGGPGLVLAVLSWKISGHPVSMLENLQRPVAVRFSDVPWLKDFWTIIKTQIWLSGMSNIVFPTTIYMLIAGAFAFLFGGTLRSVSRSGNPLSKQLLMNLLVPLLFFWIALAYFSWRNFALYRGPGGTGGWYLWAMAIPEVLVLTWGGDP